MQDGTERRMIALQEAQKTYAMQYSVQMAVGDEFPNTEDIPDKILDLAVQYEIFLFNGKTDVKVVSDASADS